MYELTVESSFSAAHQLREYGGPCENLHGHTFKVQVSVKGKELNKIGMLMDFKDIKKALKEVLAEFDHSFLNDLSCFRSQNPTAENIAKVIYDNMKKKAAVSKVTVWESPTASASFTE